MNYRFDKRSKKEFQQDIKEATKIEEAILNLWLDKIERETLIRPKYKHLADGRDGSFLKDKEVDSTADFEVIGYGKIEVKFCRPFLKTRFHLKKGQLESYIKQNCIIIIVNGWDTHHPVFTLIKPKMMDKIVEECEVINYGGMGGKPSYRIPTDMFIWRPLNE